MHFHRCISFFCFIYWAFFPNASAHAGLIFFGTGVQQFSMEFVEISDPGNTPHGNLYSRLAIPVGDVSYTFQIAKFELNREVITKANAMGSLGITMDHMGRFSTGRADNHPATGLTWFEAARFVNWLNTSQGFQSAYKFDGSGNFQLWSSTEAWQIDGENLFRHKDSQYWLPSLDEWYKAAYYDRTSRTFFYFPTGSYIMPTKVAGGTAANTAVFEQDFFQGPAEVDNAGGLSSFGTMGMGGNVAEVVETSVDFVNDQPLESRFRMGGTWLNGGSQMAAGAWEQSAPIDELYNWGVRVAGRSSYTAAPEPSSVFLIFCGLAYYGVRRWPVKKSMIARAARKV